jgi:hypothetical protein
LRGDRRLEPGILGLQGFNAFEGGGQLPDLGPQLSIPCSQDETEDRPAKPASDSQARQNVRWVSSTALVSDPASRRRNA